MFAALTICLLCLLVRLSELLYFHMALLGVPGVSFLHHHLCDFGIDISVSSAASELCLH